MNAASLITNIVLALLVSVLLLSTQCRQQPQPVTVVAAEPTPAPTPEPIEWWGAEQGHFANGAHFGQIAATGECIVVVRGSSGIAVTALARCPGDEPVPDLPVIPVIGDDDDSEGSR